MRNVSKTGEWTPNASHRTDNMDAMSSRSSTTRPASPRNLPSYSHSYAHTHAHSQFHFPDDYWEARDARPILPKAAFFMGDMRDGLPMLNMQAAFLISAKNFTEKQVGMCFFTFGISQFICLAPAGYYLDYSRDKIKWVNFSAIACASLTVFTVLTAAENGSNMGLMILWKVMQGGVTAILPPGFNGVTLGIVGSTGFTHQVSRNRMMNHIGTAFAVSVGSLIAYFLYPNIGHLFIASPIFAIGFFYYMRRIKPTHVNPEAASALIVNSPTMTEYENMDDEGNEESWEDIKGKDTSKSNQQREGYVPPATPKKNNRTMDGRTEPQWPTQNDEPTEDGAPTKQINMPDTNCFERNETAISESSPSVETDVSGGGTWSAPSWNFGWGSPAKKTGPDVMDLDTLTHMSRRPQTPMSVLLDPTLLIFTAIVFFFHMSNSTVLPLVMQSLKVRDPHTSILLSGSCILIAQLPMAYFAKICGDYSPRYGRKSIILVGLISLTARCFLLTLLSWGKGKVQTLTGLYAMKTLILSTQLLDSVGAGIFGTMYILVTNDISGGTGRFSLLLGMTTSAMCLGGTVSGYIGQALAVDFGYPTAFFALGVMSLVPFFMYALFMPETMPDYAKPKRKRKRQLDSLFKKLNKHRRSLSDRFRRRISDGLTQREQQEDDIDPHDAADEAIASRKKAPGTSLMELV